MSLSNAIHNVANFAATDHLPRRYRLQAKPGQQIAPRMHVHTNTAGGAKAYKS